MEFPAKYDNLARGVSFAIAILLSGIVVATHSPVFAIPLLLILVVSYVLSPQGYAVADGFLVVRRVAGNIRIPLHDIRGVRAADSGDLTGSIRLWGSGGMFGYYGLYRTPGLGVCRWYVTDRSRPVVVTAAKTYVVSPLDTDAFIAAMPAGAAEPPHAAESDLQRNLGRYIGLAIGGLAIALVTATLLYAPGPPGYTLTPDSLTIHDRFYPVTLKAAAIDIPAIRTVSIDGDSPWRPVMRTNGFANVHYHAGWFRDAGGQKVRMYRADGHQLVLLPPKGDGTPVLYEVKDPPAFIQQVRSTWTASPAR